jgi:hypothetical protein
LFSFLSALGATFDWRIVFGTIPGRECDECMHVRRWILMLLYS